MARRLDASLNGSFLVKIAVALAACAVAACNPGASSGGLNADGSENGGSTPGSGGSGGTPEGNGAGSSDGGGTTSFDGLGGSPPDNGCDEPGPDFDQDGFTVEDGDCNDCDPNTNPGAVEIVGEPPEDGSPYVPVDEDCDSMADNVLPTCDGSLPVAPGSAMDAAMAIDLCQVATPADRKWGVLEANFVRGNGSPTTANAQVGILPGFGVNVGPRKGATLFAVSSGKARLPIHGDACTTISCTTSGSGSAPNGYPQDVPGCPVAPSVGDDAALDLKLRAPTNATGYKFNFKFYSFEYDEYVCTNYNDQFIALVTPAPVGSQNGNISFDSQGNPVSVNIAFFDVCASCTDLGSICNESLYDCPAPFAGCCAAGPGELAGTGFDNGFGTGNSGALDAGGTSWLQSTAPIEGGSEFNIRFVIFDVGDTNLDSTTVIDSFEWIADGGEVIVGTEPAPPQ